MPKPSTPVPDITYNFVLDLTTEDIERFIQTLDYQQPIEIAAIPEIGWCLQTFLILKEKTGLNLTCTNKFREDCINIVHSDTLLKLQGTSANFIVSVRGDYPKRIWAHYHIVQNKNQESSNASFVPFWLTPGLKKRNAGRTTVKRVAYAGQTFNGNLAGSEDTWKELFEKHGVEFVTMAKDAWHDLSEIDVLLGIRNFDSRPHNTKPPSKLINAWHAQIPFIGGYDSAFTQVGIPGKDFIRVKTPKEALEALLSLKTNPKLYQDLVQEGNKKAVLFTTDTIAKTWYDILSGPVYERYKKWNLRNQEKLRFNFLLFLGVWQHKSKQIIKKLIGR